MLSRGNATHVPQYLYPERNPGLLWRAKGAWLVQGSVDCELGLDKCAVETSEILLLLVSLCVSIFVVLCVFNFFREDKDEQITPLCPQMVASRGDLAFKIRLADEAQDSAERLGYEGDKAKIMSVLDLQDNPINQVIVDYPSVSRPGPSGVAATVRLQDMHGITLATVVARNVAVMGQALALFRGCDVFGFVEPENDNMYHVRHRTGVHLLTLSGNFDAWDVEGSNAVGAKVCNFLQVGDMCRGHVTQHVDAGLIISSLLAIHVHRQLQKATAAAAEAAGSSGAEATVSAAEAAGSSGTEAGVATFNA